MSGVCYICQKPAVKKKNSQYVCDYHYDILGRYEEGRNTGAGAGIG